MFSEKPELSKLSELRDIEERQAAVMLSRPEVSSRALEEHGCRSGCSSVKTLLAEASRKAGRSLHLPWGSQSTFVSHWLQNPPKAVMSQGEIQVNEGQEKGSIRASRSLL